MKRLTPVISRAALCVALTALAWGCSSPRASVQPEPPPLPKTHVSMFHWETVGSSVEGRPIRAWVGGDGPRHVLFIGAIHGSEQGSSAPLDALIGYLSDHPQKMTGRRAVVIPMVNPDGCRRHTRCNAKGVDLNRNFPTNNFRAARGGGRIGGSQPETRALISLIDRERPAAIVSVHMPMSCVDYDGPAEALARRMSQCCGLPVKKLGSRPGSLGSWAGVDRRIPIITLELPAHPPTGPSYQEGLLNALLAVLE